MDAICNVFSIGISLTQLQTSSANLMAYASRFKTRLKGKNRVYLTQIVRLINSVADALQPLQTTKGEHIVQPASLMAGKGVDQINPHRLGIYLQESKLAWKVERYTQHTTEDLLQRQAVSTTPVLLQVQGFLTVLMNPAAEGRLFASSVNGNVHLRYTLLDPTNHFRDIVEDARAVILAGGTMSPMDDYATHLFSYLPPDRLKFHSFGHVIPSSNLCVAALDQGPSGIDFDFTFDKRGSGSLILELGNTLLELARTVPDGLVVFFPSYEYLSQVLKVWQQKAFSSSESLFDRLSAVKPILHESKTKQRPDETSDINSSVSIISGVETVLHAYTNSISSSKGGLLLSVIGGSLSEGINFSDSLGRGVVVVGLPFPNVHSAEWKAKIEYIERSSYERLKASSVGASATLESQWKAQAKAAGREYVENTCMRAVNQCIGRAIRHRNDYAAVVLIDRRYRSSKIRSKLPVWMKGSMLPDGTSFRTTEDSIKSFFGAKELGA